MQDNVPGNDEHEEIEMVTSLNRIAARKISWQVVNSER